MLGSEIKKIVFKRLDEALKPLGWKAYKSGYNPAYVLDTEQYKIFFNMGIKAGWLGFYWLEMTIKEVESYVTECIGDKEVIPGNGEIIDNKTLFRKTIIDHSFTNYDSYNCGNVETEDDVNMVVDYFLGYLFGTAKKFVETYLYLPNIVRKMEELDSANISWIHYEKGLLFCSFDGYFRGLIISKLCNDPLFQDKVKLVEYRLYEHKEAYLYKRFIPYYEKLKQLLPTIEPKYSMDSPNEEAEMEKIRAMVAKNFTPISAPTEKPKKKAAKKFVPTPPEQVNQELLSLLNPERIPKESRSLQKQFMDFFFGKKDNKEKAEKAQLQKQTIEIVGSYLDASLRNHGFCNVHRYKNVFYYTRPTDVGNLIFSFTVGDNGRLCINPPSIRLDKVEEWMQKLFYPFKPGNFGCFGTFTLQLPKPLDELNDVVKASATDENIKQLCLATWQFIEDKFDDFAENYSSPQYLWERLCAYSKKSISWERLLFGVTPPERVLRGIVFIKLCNDNDFEDKFDYVETIFKKKANDFLPALEEIKSLLPEMKKEYEVCS